MLNLHNLFSIELLYAVFITPISFINWAIYYCIDECEVWKFLLISIMGVLIIYTLLGSVLSYSILYGLKKFFYKEISKT